MMGKETDDFSSFFFDFFLCALSTLQREHQVGLLGSQEREGEGAFDDHGSEFGGSDGSHDLGCWGGRSLQFSEGFALGWLYFTNICACCLIIVSPSLFANALLPSPASARPVRDGNPGFVA